MIRAFCSTVQPRRRPVPVNTSSRRTGSDLSKSSVSDMCPTARFSGQTIVDYCPALKVGSEGAAYDPSNYFNLTAKRASMEGFIILDYFPRLPEI